MLILMHSYISHDHNGMPDLRASSFANRMFASLDVPYDPYDE